MNILYVTLSVLIVFTHGAKVRKQLPLYSTEIAHQWNVLEFGFPNKLARQHAEANGNLIPTNAIPIDVQPNYYNKNYLRTFVTIPRFQGGIPYSLATVSERRGTNGPLLEPYPNYAMHDNMNGYNCDAITSAFRVVINECNQMWVIDSGTVGTDAQCPPQLLLFDLNTDQIIHRYRFDKSLYTAGASLFITPVVDVQDPPPRGSCRRTKVYVADVNYHGLVIYDFMQNTSKRIENLYMYPDPNHGVHTVAGETFTLMDGIFGMATDKHNLYFHPLASASEYAVSLRLLDSYQDSTYQAVRPLGRRSSACAASAMDSNGNLYCVTLHPIELIKWNVNRPYDSRNIEKLPIKSEELQFVSGMKVVRNHQGKEELWMMSNRFQKMAAGTQNFNEINFRVVVFPLANATPVVPNNDLHNALIFKD